MNETTNKIHINVPSDYNGTPIELVVREGIAAKQLDQKEPLEVSICGNLDSPFNWLEKRVSTIDQHKTYILVDREEMSIWLNIDETNCYGASIKGKLRLSEIFVAFGINSSKTWDAQQLAHFIKMNRAYFPDKSENMNLVSTLKNFRAKVNQKLEQSKEDNGSMTDNFSQIVVSNIPKSFKMQLPIFKGTVPSEIEVEIYPDIDGRNVTLSLISAGANEIMEETRDKNIDIELGRIREIAPDIAIIES